MQRIFGLIKAKTEELFADGTVDRVIAWKKGEFFYDNTPAIFTTKESLEGLVYDGFCASNLSKYLIDESKKEGRVLALLKPCDTYNFNQLIKEHRINRENVYVLGVECRGMIDIDKIRALGIKGILDIEEEDNMLTIDTVYGKKSCRRSEVLLEKCICCKGKEHVAYDELITSGEEIPRAESNRFALVEELEGKTADERFAFWRGELSKCIRCNACRNICPVCSCIECVFDNESSSVASKANTDTFEENLFHIIRAFHVAGRCTDCGECSRVCPQNIPLHLLNRKIIKDINEFYGEYQAGADTYSPGPLTDFTKEDIEPSIITEKGGRK